MFRIVENLVNGNTVIRGSANTKEEARQIASNILAAGQFASFSTITIEQVIK